MPSRPVLLKDQLFILNTGGERTRARAPADKVEQLPGTREAFREARIRVWVRDEYWRQPIRRLRV